MITFEVCMKQKSLRILLWPSFRFAYKCGLACSVLMCFGVLHECGLPSGSYRKPPLSSSSVISSSCLETVSLSLVDSQLGSPVIQRFSHPHLPSPGIKSRNYHAWWFHLGTGIKMRSSCLCDKCPHYIIYTSTALYRTRCSLWDHWSWTVSGLGT